MNGKLTGGFEKGNYIIFIWRLRMAMKQQLSQMINFKIEFRSLRKFPF